MKPSTPTVLFKDSPWSGSFYSCLTIPAHLPALHLPGECRKEHRCCVVFWDASEALHSCISFWLFGCQHHKLITKAATGHKPCKHTNTLSCGWNSRGGQDASSQGGNVWLLVFTYWVCFVNISRWLVPQKPWSLENELLKSERQLHWSQMEKNNENSWS